MIPQTRTILITGMQGSGKSHLAKAFAKAGYNAVDADTIDDLSAWYDASGQCVSFDATGNQEWLDTHRYLWNREVLQAYLSARRPLVVCGASANTMEMLDLFDEVYYLKVPAEIIATRLTAHDRENSFGATPEQRAAVVARVQGSDELMKAFSVTILDGTKAPEALMADILEEKQTHV